jgi:hypothetical protein
VCGEKEEKNKGGIMKGGEGERGGTCLTVKCDYGNSRSPGVPPPFPLPYNDSSPSLHSHSTTQ